MASPKLAGSIGEDIQIVNVVNVPTGPSLVAKLVKVMQAVDHVEKAGRNEKQGYNFVRASDMLQAVRKELIAQNVLLTTDVIQEEHWEKAGSSGGHQSYCKLLIGFTFHDGDSGEKLGPLHGCGWGADYGDKAPYKAFTGALKYAVRNNFLIPDDSDPENEKPGDEQAGAPRRGKREPKRQYESIQGTVTKYQQLDPKTLWLEVNSVRVRAVDEQHIRLLNNCEGKRVELNCYWDTIGKNKIPCMTISGVLGVYQPVPLTHYEQVEAGLGINDQDVDHGVKVAFKK